MSSGVELDWRGALTSEERREVRQLEQGIALLKCQMTVLRAESAVLAARLCAFAAASTEKLKAQDIRRLYSQACHGAGAAARWEARDQIDAILGPDPEPGAMFDLFVLHDLDLASYFASRPISRPV